jgi:hypothetical protein
VNKIDCSMLGQVCKIDAENRAFCDDPAAPASDGGAPPASDGGAPPASDGGASSVAGPG